MKMWLTLGLIIGVVSCGYAADPQETKKHPIDIQVDKLAEKDPSTNGQIQAFAQGLELWDKDMNRVYNELMKALGTDESAKKALKESQVEWIKFRDNEFKFLGAIFATKEGTMYRPMQVYDRMDFVRTRALQLQARLNTVKE